MSSEYKELNKIYTKDWYGSYFDLVHQSAVVVIPYLKEMFPIKSVVDVGCGNGTWLEVFKHFGIEDVLGVDGEYVLGQNNLLIKKEEFLSMDLSAPKSISRKYDIAISLEVAEHIPKRSADAFIEFLTGTSDIILFSAAVPKQGGTYHVNEQWPSYWQEKFSKRKFVMLDPLRNKLVNNPNVVWWYKQNIMLIMKESLYVEKYSHLEKFNPDFMFMSKLVFTRSNSVLKSIRYALSQFVRNKLLN